MILDADDESYLPLLRKIKASEILRSGLLCQLCVFLLIDAAYFNRPQIVPVQYGMVKVPLTFGESFVHAVCTGWLNGCFAIAVNLVGD